MFLHVKQAKYIESYKIWIKFNNGAEGEIDLYNNSQLVKTANNLEKEKAIDTNVLL